MKLNLLVARKKKGFTQEYLASKLHVSRVMYNRYERGKTEIPVDNAKVLCELLELSLESIYDDTI